MRNRSSSGGYLDFFENQREFERKKREMALELRYDDFRRPHVPPPKSAESLQVPPPEGATHRRVRSHEEIGSRREPSSREYRTRIQQPQYSLSSDAPVPTQLPVKRIHKPRPGPKIQVQVTQPDPPNPTGEGHTPRRSPLKSASPHSPGAQPELLYQFKTIQTKLSDVQTKCAPYEDLEAANPRDLTFAKIAEEVKGYAFQLTIWGQIVHIESLGRIDKKKRDVVESVSDTLDRISDRIAELNKACLVAKPRDLKIAPLPELEDDGDDFEYGFGDEDEPNEDNAVDEIESLGARIQSYLQSIRTNMQALGRLTRSLQEASPDCMEEVVAVEKLVGEVTKFFGSEEDVKMYGIDTKYSGRKALEEARYAAERRF